MPGSSPSRSACSTACIPAPAAMRSSSRTRRWPSGSTCRWCASSAAASSTTIRPTTSTAWSAVATRSPSGCTPRPAAVPDDLDFAQLYDDYPVMAFIQLEGLGITRPGETAGFIRERGVTVRGGFPINTGGGQLSAGQAGASGGMIGVYEAVAQLARRNRGPPGRVPAGRGLRLRHGRIRPRPVVRRRGPGQGMRTAAVTPRP